LKLSKKILLTGLLLSTVKAETLAYQQPKNFDFLYNIVDDHLIAYDTITQKENLWIWGAVGASTLILLTYDKELIDESQRLGKKLGISGEDSGYRTLFNVGSFPIQVPKDTGSALYFIGDGIVHIGIAGSFLTHGLINNDKKSISVASQLAEGLTDVAITTQVLKHITGRESPFKATSDTGKWDFFPNQRTYHNDIPKYDAFPSGHVATTMMTVTVLSENYPDNRYIKPVGYTLTGLLGYQMMNNGVHWASDYPLAIVIGYTFGKIVSTRERDKAKKGLDVVPLMHKEASGLALEYKF
jgi:hypothetical protein